MNIETANRLYELRKKSGMSQEELADKLGISRQAVSKWERAEASPDTDNLISLAKIYGLSLDDLLNNKIETNEPKEEVKDEPVVEDVNVKEEYGTIVIENGDGSIRINGKDHKKQHIHESGEKKPKWLKAITSSGYIIAVIAYLFLGFFGPYYSWAVYWTLFFLPIIFESLANAIISKKLTRFNFVILVVFIYTFLGMYLPNKGISYDFLGQRYYGFWHPFWIIFLLIPIYYMIARAIDNRGNKEE